MEFKKCSKCGEYKELTAFQPDKSKTSGYKSQCKECIKNNPSRQKYMQNYRDTHKEYYREKHEEYRENNREKLATRSREFRSLHPEKTREYYIKNKDKILERCKRYRQSERGKEIRKKYYLSEKAKADKIYQRIKRRAIIINGDTDITIQKLFDRDKGVCKLCGKLCDWNDIKYKNGCTITGDNYPSIDHIKPLSKGGSHTWDNVQLAHCYCNSVKQDKTLD